MKSSILILALLVFFTSSVIGQSVPAQPELESGTIESQFDYIITKSTAYKDFQLIRKSSILKVKSNALDSIKTLRKQGKQNVSQNTQLNSQINSLKKDIASLEEEISILREDKESISLFGSNIEKSLYNIIMLTIIVVLLVLLIFFVLRFKSNNLIAKRTKRELETLELEFEQHRKKSLKKEQEIMRKLQDEINKNNP